MSSMNKFKKHRKAALAKTFYPAKQEGHRVSTRRNGDFYDQLSGNQGMGGRTTLEILDRVNNAAEKLDLVRLFLDDERPCPPGWIVARNGHQFRTLFEEYQDEIERISLDWYLGTGEQNGVDIAQWLAERFKHEPDILPKLEWLTFHSSDQDRAVEMLRLIADVIPEERKWDIIMDVCPADLVGRNLSER